VTFPELLFDDFDMVLNRFEKNLFSHLYVSNGRTDKNVFQPCFRKPKAKAFDYPLIQPNGPRRQVYITIDMDRSDAASAWRDAGKPPPNIIVENPVNGRGHLIYELTKPVWKGKPNDRRGLAPPERYFRNVKRALTAELGGDPGYNGFLVKNPFHPQWRTTVVRAEPYTLGELAQHLDLSSVPSAELVEDHAGRNCTLFESIRHWGMRVVRNYTSLSDFQAVMLDQLEGLNEEFDESLPDRELRDICKSVSRYTWRNQPVRLNPDEVKRRQSLSAARTAEVKANTTLDQLVLARQTLWADGATETNEALAALAGISVRTVQRYRAQLLKSSPESVSEGIPDRGHLMSPPSSLGKTAQSAFVSIFDPPPAENENLAGDQDGELAADHQPARPMAQAKDVVAIIHASQVAPTYEELLAQRDGNSIRVVVDVINHASAGRLIRGLPKRLHRMASQRLGLHVPAIRLAA
jgi:hypothetical protein